MEISPMAISQTTLDVVEPYEKWQLDKGRMASSLPGPPAQKLKLFHK